MKSTTLALSRNRSIYSEWTHVLVSLTQQVFQTKNGRTNNRNARNRKGICFLSQQRLDRKASFIWPVDHGCKQNRAARNKQNDTKTLFPNYENMWKAVLFSSQESCRDTITEAVKRSTGAESCLVVNSAKFFLRVAQPWRAVEWN